MLNLVAFRFVILEMLNVEVEFVSSSGHFQVNSGSVRAFREEVAAKMMEA